MSEARNLQSLDPPEPFEDFGYAPYLAEHDRRWLEVLALYRQAEYVNDHLENLVTWQERWFAVYQSKPFYNMTRTICERLLCLVAIALLLPLVLVIGAAIRVSSKGPVFYSQLRVGRYCQPFRIYKFRTMHANSSRAVFDFANEMQGGLFKIKGDPRITKIGKVLRRWSLDELPQLWNVVRGDMSLVGPRPLTLEDTCTIPKDCYIRFAVRPGITGYWQATARDVRDGAVKVRMDADYVKLRNWRFDLWLLGRTVVIVLKGKGAW